MHTSIPDILSIEAANKPSRVQRLSFCAGLLTMKSSFKIDYSFINEEMRHSNRVKFYLFVLPIKITINATHPLSILLEMITKVLRNET